MKRMMKRESEALRRLQHNFLSASPNLPAPQDNEPPPVSSPAHTRRDTDKFTSTARCLFYFFACLHLLAVLLMSTYVYILQAPRGV